MEHIQHAIWNGPPEELRELFTLTNARGAPARCALWSHPFGWELRLPVNDCFIRSQVCRAFGDVDQYVFVPTAGMRPSVSAVGWPYGFAFPTEMIPTRGVVIPIQDVLELKQLPW